MQQRHFVILDSPFASAKWVVVHRVVEETDPDSGYPLSYRLEKSTPESYDTVTEAQRKADELNAAEAA